MDCVVVGQFWDFIIYGDNSFVSFLKFYYKKGIFSVKNIYTNLCDFCIKPIYVNIKYVLLL